MTSYVCIVHHDPCAPLAILDEFFKMKEGSIQVPTFYLGAKLKKGMSSRKYVHSVVQNVQENLAVLPGDQKLLRRASGPFKGGYNPELDDIIEFDPIRANLY
jgi:hypothetical protein